MAIIDSFTMVAGLYNPYGTYYGFRSSTQQGSIGTINGSNANYSINPLWIGNQSSIQKLERGTDPGFTGIRLEVAANGTPPNSGWYDLRIGSSTYLRTDASSNSINSGYGRDWKWSTLTNPLSNGGTYNVVVTNDGSLGGVSGTKIPLGISSGAISMGNLKEFYGKPVYTSETISMSDLYKGGNLVPSIGENSSIPLSGAISLSNFYSSYTVLNFEKQPINKWIEEFSTQSTGTMQAQWVMNITPTGQGDFDIGYGMLKASDIEYRWTVTGGNQLTRMVIDGTVYTTSSSTYTSPWGSTGTLQLERDWLSANTSFEISGTAKLEVRKIWNSVTYSATSGTASWKLHKFNSIE
jgi:hypothetical protein